MEDKQGRARWLDEQVEMYKVEPVFDQIRNQTSREQIDGNGSRNKLVLKSGQARVDELQDIMEFYTFEPKSGEEKKVAMQDFTSENPKPLESFGPEDGEL